MASKVDRPLIFLMATVVAADATPGADGKARPSSAKMKKMNAVLERRLPELETNARWQAVGKALSGMPDIADGIKLLTLVEKQAKKLSALLEGRQSRARRVLQYLIAIADADNEITDQELRVIQTAARGMGVSEALIVGADAWGETTLRVA